VKDYTVGQVKALRQDLALLTARQEKIIEKLDITFERVAQHEEMINEIKTNYSTKDKGNS
jgi:hypothetical protein